MAISWQTGVAKLREGFSGAKDRAARLAGGSRKLSKRVSSWRRKDEVWEPCAIYQSYAARVLRWLDELEALPTRQILMKPRDYLEQVRRLEDEMSTMIHHVHTCTECRGTPQERKEVRDELRYLRHRLEPRKKLATYAKWSLVVLVPLVGQLLLLLWRTLIG